MLNQISKSLFFSFCAIALIERKSWKASIAGYEQLGVLIFVSYLPFPIGNATVMRLRAKEAKHRLFGWDDALAGLAVSAIVDVKATFCE